MRYLNWGYLNSPMNSICRMLLGSKVNHRTHVTSWSMLHRDFQIGLKFWWGDGLWRVTDIGTRTVIAIRIDRIEIEGGAADHTPLSSIDLATAEAAGWFDGPPYGVLEIVLDEVDVETCWLASPHRSA